MSLDDHVLRQLEPKWSKAMVAASIAISFLGAFTSTQLMCHARMSSHFSSVFVWALLGSLIFGFCSIWCLHEVAMLAYEFDIRIGVDALLTFLSAILAVSFTFVAMAADLLWVRYRSRMRRKKRKRSSARSSKPQMVRKLSDYLQGRLESTQSSTPLLEMPEPEDEEEELLRQDVEDLRASNSRSSSPGFTHEHEELTPFSNLILHHSPNPHAPNTPRISEAETLTVPAPPQASPTPEQEEDLDRASTRSPSWSSTDYSFFRRGSSSSVLSSTLGIIYRKGTDPAKNAFAAMARILYEGFTRHNLAKGFFWSLAITSMHYVGIIALRVPQGYFKLNPWLVALSALISWIVCTVGCILMPQMETHLPQQLLFSAIATSGVAAMHFTGMRATTFWTTMPASELTGFPPALANSVVAIAFLTCIVANVFVAHSATVSRNKLAEIVWTRKELWRTIALKEHAEADARARSEFIASASHEIRTPLHHLQGYSDLLAQQDLTEEGRNLLRSIQRATKTLSLITNNVLDWSKFEQNNEEVYRPSAIDVRSVCESVVVLLPNLDEDVNVDVYVVVSPEVPQTLFLDETWVHRILMNLLSNALKFTRNGYIKLSLNMSEKNLVANIEDTGCGLDPAFIPEMWTPFKQGEVRGSARGTGLGLSIIKQLVQRMEGRIEVESNYEHLEDIGPDRSGTRFTVTLPVQTARRRSVPATSPKLESRQPKIAILWKGTPTRAIEGLQGSWELFGFEVTLVSHVNDLHADDWKYVWGELEFFSENKGQFFTLLQSHKKWLVLVPYDAHNSMEGLPGITSAPNFVMLHKPLIWHTFERRITNQVNAPSQALRFAESVEVLNEESADLTEPSYFDFKPRRRTTVLLVEDNPINQRLGKKMLLSLGYNVITSMDGQDAIDTLLRHNPPSSAVPTPSHSIWRSNPPTPMSNGSNGGGKTPPQSLPAIDIILMDQSMPRKDGITATREIRNMEALGRLTGRKPIIAVTAVVNSEAQAFFREAGADEFLAKPLALQKLKEALEGQLVTSSQ